MEPLYEKYGWIIYFALGLLWLVVGLNQVFLPDTLMGTEVQRVTGMSLSELDALNPSAIELVRFLFGVIGNLKISWSLFVLVITLTGYRKGERWAWYTLWLCPAILVGQGLFDSVFLGDFNEMLQWIPILTISLLGLLIPFRKFFPRNLQTGNL